MLVPSRKAVTLRSPAVNEHPEGAGDRGWARVGFVLGRRRRRTKIRRDGVGVVIALVEGHGAGARFGGYLLNRSIAVGRVLMSNGDGAGAARREHELRLGIKAGGVYSLADRPSGDHLAVCVVH